MSCLKFYGFSATLACTSDFNFQEGSVNILVTGAAGFIGSHLAERLLAGGHTVVGIDNFDSFYDPSIKRKNIRQAMSHKKYRLVEGDIRDAIALGRCFESGSIDVVAHLAARAGVRPSIANPELYFDVNVMGTLRVLEAMRTAGATKMVFASSSSVYGNNPHVPFREGDNVDHPISPYAASKKAAELLCHTYHHLFGFDVHALRFFTAYGPRQRPEMAISHFARRIREGRPVELYGDGKTSRDYTYIDDIVRGVDASLASVKGFEIINLGNSKPATLIDLVRMLEEAIGQKATISWCPMQPGDVGATWAAVEKAGRLLGYSPCTTLREGLSEFVRWLQTEGA